MKTAQPLVPWFALFSIVSGCAGYSSEEEATFKEYVDFIKSVPQVMSTVKDSASAKVAEPKYKEFVKRFPEIKKRFFEIPESHRQALAKKYEGEVKAARNQHLDEISRYISGTGDDDSQNMLLKLMLILADPSSPAGGAP